jgi:hypothetical protein
MSYENISAQLSDEDLNQVIAKLTEAEKLLPFVIDLTNDEIRSLFKLGDKSLPFVDKALELAAQNPDYVPKYVDLEELKKDIELAKKLKTIMNVLMPLAEKVSDTYHAVGSEAFLAARMFYVSVKNASRGGVPGTDTIAAELGKRFEKRFRKRENEEETVPA